VEWFRRTHEVEAVGVGSAIWRLRQLPTAGGLGAQDARLMSALDATRSVANELLRSSIARRSQEDELRAFHEQETVH